MPSKGRGSSNGATTGGKKRALQPASEDETRLAQSLFGGGIVSRTSKRSKQASRFEAQEDDDEADLIAAERPAQEQFLEDDDLFVLDTGADQDDEAEGSTSGSSSASSSVADSDEEEEQKEQVDVEEAANVDRPQRLRVTGFSSKRKPVWTDPSSATLTVALSGADAKAVDGSRRGTNKLRHLRESADEVYVNGTEYELRLRRTFEKLHPRPRWASLEMREAARNGAANGLSSLGDLLNTDISLVKRLTGEERGRRGTLPPQRLQVQRLHDANEALPSKRDPIHQLAFHPSDRANVLLMAEGRKTLRMFHIDGQDNPHLESIVLSDMVIQTARFHPSGSSILITGPRPYLYVHDLYAGKTVRSTPWRGYGGRPEDSTQERDLTVARFAPAQDQGRQLAIGGRRGAIHLLDFKQMGGSSGANLIGTMQMNNPLAGLCWDPAKPHSLASISQQGVLHVWDTRRMTCEVQRYDTDLFAPRGLEASPSGHLWAVGSQDGIVNVYGRDAVEGDATTGYDGQQRQAMSARKTIRNIVTATSTMEYNPTGEILAIASKEKKNVLKMVHVPSLTVFENWPTSNTPLNHVSAVAFSTRSELMAIGRTRGKVLLYSLPHYG